MNRIFRNRFHTFVFLFFTVLHIYINDNNLVRGFLFTTLRHTKSNFRMDFSYKFNYCQNTTIISRFFLRRNQNHKEKELNLINFDNTIDLSYEPKACNETDCACHQEK